MNYVLAFLVFMSASPLLSEPNYLGTNRADVEAGLRAYTEKQLSDMRRKDRFDGMRPEPVDSQSLKTQEVEDEKPKNWDDEIATLIQAETSKQKTNLSPKSASYPAWFNRPRHTMEIAPKKIDWQQTGVPGIGPRDKSIPMADLITIPAGSYIMADLLTGVDAPTQTSIPVLIRTRFGFVSPNDGFVDLSGCHIVAQATGDLSTERVKMKTVTLSCLSPDKVPQEQIFTAFAVGEDGSFGIPGELRSRQGRVAMMVRHVGVV